MLFTDLRLQNFRSYTDSSFELGPGVNIVVGPNAIGKTNLLEALMLSAGSKSYRAKDDALLNTAAEWARIDTHTDANQTRTIKIKRDLNSTFKSFEIDQKQYKRFPQTEKIPVVLFEPNDLFLLSGDPSARRLYFDDIIAKYSPGYENLLKKYKRVVAQRNSLLKQGHSGTSQIFAWNLRLCELASEIVKKRIELVELINKNLAKTYNKIATGKLKVCITYTTKIQIENYSTDLMNKLESTIDLDLARGFTGNGPHRDDLVVYFGDSVAAQRASRGEIRTLLLSLKILELKLLEDQTSKRPLLLLDDVFSELDGARRRALTEYLQGYQTIITTTDADVVVQHFTENTTVIPIALNNTD